MKLRRRLALFFFAVILVGALSSLVLVRLTTENLFRSFVFSGDAAKAKAYATILSEYYSANHNWGNVQTFLSEIPKQVFLTLDKSIHGAGEGEAATIAAYPYETIRSLVADRVAVADLRGVIVADTSGRLLGTVHPPRHLAHGYAIRVDFEKVGPGRIDGRLLAHRRRRALPRLGIRIDSVGHARRELHRPPHGPSLHAPRDAPPRVAQRGGPEGGRGRLVDPGRIRSKDEIAELSVSFNTMTEALRRLEEAKKRIIADAAHELRTPVTLLQGTVEAMIDGVYPLDTATLRSMHEETIRLSGLIDSLRELETIESGELELDLKEVDVLEIARKAVSLFAAQASAKSIELSVESGESGTPGLVADYLRLGEVVYNLISNAIKYSPEGSRVRVSVSTDEVEGADPAFVCIAVEDSGPGIPEEERERIFERFYRIDRSRAQDSGGRGLGLAIASEIVKAHGVGSRSATRSSEGRPL